MLRTLLKVLLVLAVLVGVCLGIWLIVYFWRKYAMKNRVSKYNRPAKTDVDTGVVHYELRVMGVTKAEGRQDAIRNLKVGSELMWMPLNGIVGDDAKAYPNAVGVFCYARDCGMPEAYDPDCCKEADYEFSKTMFQLGWIPDGSGAYRTSIAKMFRDKLAKGKTPVIVGWYKKGGSFRRFWGLRLKIENPK